MHGRIEAQLPAAVIRRNKASACIQGVCCGAAATALLLCVGCASPEAYRLPDGGTTGQRSLDFHDCRQLAGMQRDKLQQLAIEEDCMGARGYRPDTAAAD